MRAKLLVTIQKKMQVTMKQVMKVPPLSPLKTLDFSVLKVQSLSSDEPKRNEEHASSLFEIP